MCSSTQLAQGKSNTFQWKQHQSHVTFCQDIYIIPMVPRCCLPPMPPAVGSTHLTSAKYDVASQWHSNFKVEAIAKFEGQRKKAKDARITVIKASISWGQSSKCEGVPFDVLLPRSPNTSPFGSGADSRQLLSSLCDTDKLIWCVFSCR